MKGISPRAGAALLMLLSPSLAWPQDVDDSENDIAYIGILGNYVEADDDRHVDYGTGVELIYGWQLSGPWLLEARAFTENLETDTDDFTDFYRHGLGLDVQYAFASRPAFTPFLLLGGGGAYNDVAPDDDKFNGFVNAGLGLASAGIGRYDLRLRADARYIYDFYDDGFGDVKIGLGIEIPLNKPAPAVAMEPEVVERVRVVEPEPLPDGDGDGVPDEDDRCPNTPTGLEVDVSGCALPQVLALDGVNFEFNSARLDANSKRILDAIVEQVKGYTEAMDVEIAGHTDSLGSETYNQGLSEKRAESVRAYLSSTGIDGSRLSAVGYGESDPVADNETEEGRELNRRVELRLAGEQ